MPQLWRLETWKKNLILADTFCRTFFPRIYSFIIQDEMLNLGWDWGLHYKESSPIEKAKSYMSNIWTLASFLRNFLFSIVPTAITQYESCEVPYFYGEGRTYSSSPHWCPRGKSLGLLSKWFEFKPVVNINAWKSKWLYLTLFHVGKLLLCVGCTRRARLVRGYTRCPRCEP